MNPEVETHGRSTSSTYGRIYNRFSRDRDCELINCLTKYVVTKDRYLVGLGITKTNYKGK